MLQVQQLQQLPVLLRLDLWVFQFLCILQGKTCLYLQQCGVCDCCIVDVKDAVG